MGSDPTLWHHLRNAGRTSATAAHGRSFRMGQIDLDRRSSPLRCPTFASSVDRGQSFYISLPIILLLQRQPTHRISRCDKDLPEVEQTARLLALLSFVASATLHQDRLEHLLRVNTWTRDCTVRPRDRVLRRDDTTLQHERNRAARSNLLLQKEHRNHAVLPSYPIPLL